MSHPFHYFTPGIPAAKLAPGNILSKAVLPTVHLGHLAGHLTKSSDISIQDVVNLGGHQGAFFTPTVGGRPAEVVTFNPDESKQRWLKTEKVWIGWEVGNEPGPDELQRKTAIDRGYAVADSSGREWTIPIARSPKNRETLPCDYEWDLETGEPIKTRKESHEWLWELSGKLEDYWNNVDVSADPAWIHKQAVACLSFNYAIGLIELNAFKAMGKSLLDDKSIALITMAVFDMNIIKQVDELKKNAAVSTPE